MLTMVLAKKSKRSLDGASTWRCLTLCKATSGGSFRKETHLCGYRLLGEVNIASRIIESGVGESLH